MAWPLSPADGWSSWGHSSPRGRGRQVAGGSLVANSLSRAAPFPRVAVRVTVGTGHTLSASPGGRLDRTRFSRCRPCPRGVGPLPAAPSVPESSEVTVSARLPLRDPTHGWTLQRELVPQSPGGRSGVGSPAGSVLGRPLCRACGGRCPAVHAADRVLWLLPISTRIPLVGTPGDRI